MSEKATLLTSIPPIAKPSPVKNPQQQTAVSRGEAIESEGIVATEAVGVNDVGQSISAFQGAIYVSFVLTFCLAGFAAVVLFRKASKIAEARFVVGAKALAVASGVIALHGFFATYLYANYLNGEGAIPLPLMMVLWAFVGLAIAVVLNHLLAPDRAPEKGAVAFDACAYFVIFSCAVIALIPGIKEDASLIFSLLSVFLFIVPVTRSLGAFRKAMARHPELRETSDRVLIYSLLALPALLPVVVFAHTCGMSDELTLFLFNFLTFDFVLVAALAMVVSADDMSIEAEVADTKKADRPATAQPEPAVVEFSAPPQPKSKKIPPRKPSKVASNAILPPAPRKPGASSSFSASPKAPNAPLTVKAPAKPKKRF